jgi:hypothetical protein
MQLLKRVPAVDTLFQNLVERKYQDRGPSRNEWRIVDITVGALSPVAKIISRQQTRLSEYWLLSDSTMEMMQLFYAYSSHSSEVPAGMDDCSETFKTEVMTLISRIKSRVLEAIRPSDEPLLEYSETKAHVMLSQMLDPRSESWLAEYVY